ncbi:hypothetical protein ACP4OV_004893 [Aristida adscensionis]
MSSSGSSCVPRLAAASPAGGLQRAPREQSEGSARRPERDPCSTQEGVPACSDCCWVRARSRTPLRHALLPS